jgi:hypothetical protein
MCCIVQWCDRVSQECLPPRILRLLVLFFLFELTHKYNVVFGAFSLSFVVDQESGELVVDRYGFVLESPELCSNNAKAMAKEAINAEKWLGFLSQWGVLERKKKVGDTVSIVCVSLSPFTVITWSHSSTPSSALQPQI